MSVGARLKRRPAGLLRWTGTAAAVIVLLLAAQAALKEAWADQLYMSGAAEAIERAAALSPDRALYRLGLAAMAERSGGDPLPHLREAARRSPADASIRIHLGLRQEIAGDVGRAEAELVEAARLSRKYLPRWTLANFYYRQGRRQEFFHWTREALAISYGDRTALFELCWRTRPDAEFLIETVLPARSVVQSDFARFLMARGALEPAGKLLEEVARTASAADCALLIEGSGILFDGGAHQAAAEVWNELCRRKLLPYAPLDPRQGPLVVNGDFARRTVGGGFDWEVAQLDGVFVAPVPAGGWQVTLTGRQPESCRILRQRLLVAPGLVYRVRCRHRTAFGALDEGTATGLRWRLRSRGGGLLAESPPISTGREQEAFEFRSDAPAIVLSLEFERLRHAVRPEGVLELFEVQLEAAGENR